MPKPFKGFRGAVRICHGFEVLDIHRTSRLDDFTCVNEVLLTIAGDRHQSRDGMTAVSDLDRFPRGHFFEVLARVLPQLPGANSWRLDM